MTGSTDNTKQSSVRKYWGMVHNVIKKTDLLLMVLDARLIDRTRNLTIEKMVQRYRKPMIHVINKSDLVSKEECERAKDKFEHCVFISAKKHMGTNVLRSKIMAMTGGKKITVGVIGYPNTGKSSVINALTGRASAKTAPVPGYTKSIQLIKASSKIYMLDTPGVIPYSSKDEKQQAFISSASPHNLKNPDDAALFILEKNKSKIKKWFDIDVTDELPEDILEQIAKKLNLIKKGNLPDTARAAMKVLHDWQQAKLR